MAHFTAIEKLSECAPNSGAYRRCRTDPRGEVRLMYNYFSSRSAVPGAGTTRARSSRYRQCTPPAEARISACRHHPIRR